VSLRFLRWWGHELAALLPGGGRAEREAAGPWLTLACDEPGRVRARLGTGRNAQVLADVAAEPGDALAGELGALASSLDPRRTRCRFLVPREQALVKDMDLPLAAEENLHEVLVFEMSRHTPFRPEDVWFSHQVLSRDGAHLRVRLCVLPRARLQALLQPFDGWRLAPEREPVARAGDDDGGPVALAFRPAAWRRRSWAGLNWTLACTVLGLAALAVWQPIAAQREARENLQQRVAAARTEAGATAALRERLDALRGSRALIASARGARPPMTVLLEAVTRALPDGTYLFRFEVRDGQVDLHGSSTAASSLIGILETTGELAGVRFASPVTRDGATGRERFHIVAELVAPAPAPPPPPATG